MTQGIAECLFVQVESKISDWNGGNPRRCTVLAALFNSSLTILREATSNCFGMTGDLLVVGLVYFCSNLLLRSVDLLCIFIHRALDAADQWGGPWAQDIANIILSSCYCLLRLAH